MHTADGRPVIGIVGRDVPALLVAGAGAQPFRIPPADLRTGDTGLDDAYAVMGRAVDRAAAAVLAAVLSGELDHLSGILISHDSEGSLRLFYTLQELHRRGRTAVPVHLVDQVHLARESTVRFNTGQLSAMWDVVSDWTSTSITSESLESSRAELAELRVVLEQLRMDRHSGRVSGVAALRGYRAAATVAPAEAIGLLQRDRHDRPEHDDVRIPMFLTGSAPLGDDLYLAIEEAGMLIVGEDHDWGDPILSDRLPETIDPDRNALLRELALARLNGAPASASSSMASRAHATRTAIVASGARALLSVVRPHDEAPAWDWHHQSAQAGVPGVMVRGDAADDPAQVVEAVTSLRASVGAAS